MKPSVAVLLLFLLFVQSSNARPWYSARSGQSFNRAPVTIAPVVLTPMQAAAKAILDRMADKLNHAEGVEFDAVITYPTGSLDNIILKTVHVSTTLERTAKLLLVAKDASGNIEGVVTASGTLFTLFDAPTNKYVQITTSRDIWSLEQALELAGKEIYARPTTSGSDLRAAIGFPIVFFDKVYDTGRVEPSVTLSYTSSESTTEDGTSVDVLTETLASIRNGSVAITYLIDPITYLPVEFSQIETRPGGKPFFDTQETFKNVQILRTKLPDSTYVYTPTSGAIPVH
jgi:outer membrane lipoprotein-sorting protein